MLLFSLSGPGSYESFSSVCPNTCVYRELCQPFLKLSIGPRRSEKPGGKGERDNLQCSARLHMPFNGEHTFFASLLPRAKQPKETTLLHLLNGNMPEVTSAPVEESS
ncbi:unnamed protein product, partial [Ectocarpus sp. 13 AM-2016]